MNTEGESCQSPHTNINNVSINDPHPTKLHTKKKKIADSSSFHYQLDNTTPIVCNHGNHHRYYNSPKMDSSPVFPTSQDILIKWQNIAGKMEQLVLLEDCADET
jgi:hypothetical protein